MYEFRKKKCKYIFQTNIFQNINFKKLFFLFI